MLNPRPFGRKASTLPMRHHPHDTQLYIKLCAKDIAITKCRLFTCFSVPYQNLVCIYAPKIEWL